MPALLRLCLLGLSALFVFQHASPQVRIRDVVDVEGVRANDLVGYGIVVGLNGTGDSVRNAPFTEDSLAHLLERLGVNVQSEAIKPKNVAAVLVTATLPPFARAGSTLDISVSSIGDASSLEGGTLILTPLKGADNETYAVAQGALAVGGYDVRAEGARERRGTPTSGSVPGGARVEREVGFAFNNSRSIRLALRNPDFTTAARVEEAINRGMPERPALMLDPGTVEIDLAVLSDTPARVIAAIENLPVTVSSPARILIDEQTGTIVMSADVKVSQVAVAQGNIAISVRSAPVAVQPNPFAPGETIVLPRSDIALAETGTRNIGLIEPNVNLSDLIDGLNRLGVAPSDIADVLRAIHATGAIQAELVIR